MASMRNICKNCSEGYCHFCLGNGCECPHTENEKKAA